MPDPEEPTTPAADAATASPAEVEAPPQPKVDESAPPLELAYTGDESGTPFVDGVPARDLTSHDVDRLVRRRTSPGPGEAGLLPGEEGFDEARQALVDELTATGIYRDARTPKPSAEQLEKRHSRDELVAMATALGLDADGTKADIATRIADRKED